MKVFISATSRDLKECRQAACGAVLTGDVQPVVQEHFPPDERPLDEYLELAVGQCDAVIALVGHVFGAAPREQAGETRSYTQLEYDYARKHDKPVFVFLASDRFAPDPEEDQALQRNQQERRRALLEAHKCEWFDNPQQLELRLAYALPRIREACGRVPMYFRHLPSPPPWFAGREDECAQLREALSRSTPSLIAVIGIGGQGKTTLVHQVVRERLAIPTTAGFWCTAHRTGYSFDAFVDDALEHLSDGAFDRATMPDLDARVTELLRRMQRDRMLVVIDGIEAWIGGGTAGDAGEAPDAREDRRGNVPQFDDFLRQASGLGAGSHLVVTSRVLPAVLDESQVATIPVRDPRQKRLGLDGLDPEAAAALMRSLGVVGDDGELQSVAQRLACHPLALRVVSGYVREEYGGTLRDLPSLDEAGPERALSRLFEDIEVRLPLREESRRLLQVLSLTIESPALDVLTDVLAQSDVQAQSDLRAAGPGTRAASALRKLASTLARYQLISFDPGQRTIAAHPLVKQHFAATLDEADAREIHLRFAYRYAKEAVPERATTLNDVRPRLLGIEHALAARNEQAVAERLLEPFVPPYDFAAWCGSFGHFVSGADVLARAAAIASPGNRSRFLIPRSTCCLPMGKIDEAIADLSAAIEELERIPDASPDQRSELAGALTNRGNAYSKIARHEQAARDLDRAIATFEDLAPLHVRYRFFCASARTNRGLLRRSQGRLRDAVTDYDFAVEVYRRHLGPELNRINADLAGNLTNRANALGELRQFDAAVADYDAAEAIYQARIDLGHPQFEGLRARLHALRGSVRLRQSKLPEALAELDQAVAGLQALVDAGKEHLEPALAFAKLARGVVLAESADHAAALADGRAATELCARLVGRGRPDLQGQWIHSLLAEAYCKFKSGDDADAQIDVATAEALAFGPIANGEEDVRLIVVRYLLAYGDEIRGRIPESAAKFFHAALRHAEAGLSANGSSSDALLAELTVRFAPGAEFARNCRSLGCDERLLERVENLVRADGRSYP